MLKRYLGILLLSAVAGSALAAAGLDTGRYAVILTDSSVAQHVASLKGARGAAPAEYRQQVVAGQAALRQELQKRNLRVTGAVQTLLNAVFVVASKDEAAQLRALPGVKAVVPLHRYRLRLDKAVQLTNVPAAWSQLGGTAHAGAGIKIAILDTGIDQTHPGFQDASLQAPADFPKCDVQQNWKCADFTSNKVIVARSYVPMLAAGTQPNPAVDSRPDDVSPRDHIGHGTALAMIAAGVTNSGPADTITGVAPKAFLGSYKVFGSPGVNDFTFGDVIIQALEDALNDGMDVAGLSLGSPAFSGPLDVGAICGETGSNPCDPEAMAVETAVQSGMMVVVAAGNDGESGLYTLTLNSISSPATAPSAIAAGASTNSHTFGPSVEVQGQNVPQNLQSIPAQLGDGPVPAASLTAPLRDVTALDGTGYACSALPASSLNGMIALIVRSSQVCYFVTKVLNAQAAGAVGVILIQAPGQGAAIPPGGLSGTQIPTVMIGDSDGQALQSYLASNPGLSGTIDPTLRPVDVSVYNEVAPFSSHGPSIDLRLKPEMVAVGTNMYMAAQRFDPNGMMYDPSGYTVADGTSFSTPMISGALALVKQAHPNFTTWQLKSAVVNTATQDVTENGSTASVVSTGNGKLSAGDAIQTVVTVNPAAVSFGALVTGTTPTPQTLTIHYSGTSAATLTLAAVPALSALSASGPAPSLSRTVLPVVPGQADSAVTLTLPTAVPRAGIYEGGIVIQGAGATLRVPYLYVVGDGVPDDVLAVGGYFDGTVGQPIPTGPFLLKLIDYYGVPVAGRRVTFRGVSGGGTILDADTQTNSEGVAGADAALGPLVGTQVFSVSISGLQTISFSGIARILPTIAGVANSANYSVVGVPISPGSYITLWGNGLSDYIGSTTTAALPLGIIIPDPSGNYIDYNVSVSFDVPSANLSLPGRMLYVSPGQVNVQVPWELAGQKSVLIKVTVGDSPGRVFTASVSSFAPAVYLIPDPQTSQPLAAALDLNAALISSLNPAHPNQTIQLYLNGLGDVTNRPAIGFVAQAEPLSNTLATPTATIGGKAATVLFSGLTPTTSGLYQINLRLAPDTPTGTQPLMVSIGGISSPAVNIPVQ
jgi:minor extracellular serine protease Vpr